MKAIQIISLLACLLLLSVAGVSAQTDGSCCVGRVGDINGMGGDEPTIGDISMIVEYKYINPALQLDCLSEADINQSGGMYPTINDISIGDISLLIDYLFITGPASATLPICLDPATDPYGYLRSMSDCNTSFVPAAGGALSSEGCVQWEYSLGQLLITHQNAGFNCCPEVEFRVEVVGDTIRIGETEIAGYCDCLCLYDIHFVVNNLPSGAYRVVINEPYLPVGDSSLDQFIVLTPESSGRFCQPRSGYPWNSGTIDGFLLGHGSCKSNGVALSSTVPLDQDCVVYSYDPTTQELRFTHANAAFNCCPDQLLAEFSIDGNTITITESETFEMGGCHCLCLFDLEYVIVGVTPGEYQIILNEPYVGTDEPRLDFTVELTGAVAEEMFCIQRDNYPWGI